MNTPVTENPFVHGRVWSVSDTHIIASVARQLNSSGQMGQFPDLYVYEHPEGHPDASKHPVRVFALSELSLDTDAVLTADHYNFSMGLNAGVFVPAATDRVPVHHLYYDPNEPDGLTITWLEGDSEFGSQKLKDLQIVQQRFEGDDLRAQKGGQVRAQLLPLILQKLRDQKFTREARALERNNLNWLVQVGCAQEGEALVVSLSLERYLLMVVVDTRKLTVEVFSSRRWNGTNPHIANDNLAGELANPVEHEGEFLTFTEPTPYEYDQDLGRYSYLTRFYQFNTEATDQQDASALFLELELPTSDQFYPTHVHTNMQTDHAWMLLNQLHFGPEDGEQLQWGRSLAVRAVTNPEGGWNVPDVPLQSQRVLFFCKESILALLEQDGHMVCIKVKECV